MKKNEQEQEQEREVADLQKSADIEIVGMYKALEQVKEHAQKAGELWRMSIKAGRRKSFSLEITYYSADLGSIERFSKKFLENIGRNKRLQALIEGANNERK